MSSKISPLDLDELVRSVARRAIRESLSPGAGEKDAQDAMAGMLKPFQKSKRDKKPVLKSRYSAGVEEDLEEAEDEENQPDSKKSASRPAEKSERPAVSSKMATGKEEPKPEAVIPDPSDVKDVTFDQVINMMNMMRSGRSTKNPDTRNSLRDYFKGLDSGERQALFVLLSGLTQILAGGISGDEAPDPSEVGIRINPQSPDKKSVETSKQKSVSGPKPAAPSQATKVPGSPNKELPIVVGESADRRALVKRVAALRSDK
jgi:hypothetical protein